jgi:hypothetical protein
VACRLRLQRPTTSSTPALGLAYDDIDQTTSATGAAQTVAMTYAGAGPAERTPVGATVQRNGILGVQALPGRS